MYVYMYMYMYMYIYIYTFERRAAKQRRAAAGNDAAAGPQPTVVTSFEPKDAPTPEPKAMPSLDHELFWKAWPIVAKWLHDQMIEGIRQRILARLRKAVFDAWDIEARMPPLVESSGSDDY